MFGMFFVIVIVSDVLLIAYFWQRYQRSLLLSRPEERQSVNAEMTEKKKQRTEYGVNHVILVRFQVSGKEQKQKLFVSEEAWEKAAIGEKLNLYVVTKHPQILCLTDGIEDYQQKQKRVVTILAMSVPAMLMTLGAIYFFTLEK